MILKGAEIGRYLARPDPTRPALLIYGQDAMRVALKRAEAVKALVGPGAEEEMRLTRLPGSDLRKDPAQLLDAVKAVGFFPGQRVVLVDDAPDAAAPAVAAALEDWRTGDAVVVVRMRMLEQPEATAESAVSAPVQPVSRLRNWPVQIKLAPIHAPYFAGAKLLIAADCTAYAYANFHQEFMRGKVTLIGCPKLDAVDYSEKLTEILRSNDIQSVTILRMEVPCCGGLEMAAKKALQTSGKFIPWQVVTISIDGKILD